MPATPTKRAKQREDELQTFLFLRAKRDAAEEALEQLAARLPFAADREERAYILSRLPKLRLAVTLARQEITAHLAGQVKLSPPTKEQLAKVKRLVKQLERLIAKRTRAKKIITLTTKALEVAGGVLQAAATDLVDDEGA